MTTTLRNRIVAQPPMRLDEAHATCMTVKDLAGLRPRKIEDHTRFHGYFRTYLSTLGLTDPKVEDVTVDICRRYIGYLKNERTKTIRDNASGRPEITVGLNPVTINIRLRAYKAQWNFYVREGYVACNPWDAIPLMKIDEEEIHVFSREHISKLLMAPDHRTFVGYRNYVLILTLIDTGCRISELLLVNERDVGLSRQAFYTSKDATQKVAALDKYHCLHLCASASENYALKMQHSHYMSRLYSFLLVESASHLQTHANFSRNAKNCWEYPEFECLHTLFDIHLLANS